ncbi:MAG: hypothetical protein AUG44_08700 [Actinobacteria bacterium 13_1_20CM_3_71_11]|nr:MAG: hypothetical protein AUG44_08700 [Actinobacteria bacterium 13_1_20CM_3_71_11]
MRKADLLVAPITISILSLLAVYVMLMSPEVISNKIVTSVTVVATGSAAFVWVRVWARTIAERIAELHARCDANERKIDTTRRETEEAINDVRADLVVDRATRNLHRTDLHVVSQHI